ncbi:MAG: hypothetical protein K2P58_08665 [Hyphomonadaceae bacterium]|nr:hypothetical protein [Hyphomonadaceae bacterium]
MRRRARPPAAAVGLSITVTGHRSAHPGLTGRSAAVEDALNTAFAVIHEASAGFAQIKLHTMLADGVDQAAARLGQALNWEIVAPLPFGPALTSAIGASGPGDDEETRRALLEQAADAEKNVTPSENAAISVFFSLARRARVFALAERDEHFAAGWIGAARDSDLKDSFEAEASERYALAARTALDQSDLLLAIWDGGSHAFIGGTGHTIRQALEAELPVIWIDAAAPDRVRLLRSPEDIANPPEPSASAIAILLAELEQRGRCCLPTGAAARYLRERQRHGNFWLWRAYRLIERLFGSTPQSSSTALRVRFPAPSEHGALQWRSALLQLTSLVGANNPWLETLATRFSDRFGWADSIATELSDAYRGGMVLNFVLAALAVLANTGDAPLGLEGDLGFGIAELALIALIIIVTLLGVNLHWHRRWLESRRVAEYLRHNFFLLPLGVIRPAARWPRSVQSSWPEEYARASIREIGLPPLKISAQYLQTYLFEVLRQHIDDQLNYHRMKAARLHAVHKRLDTWSIRLFSAALLISVIAVTLNFMQLTAPAWFEPWAAFLAVALPMSGATISGIRFFGDFERFATISDVAAGKLALLLQHLDSERLRHHALDYSAAVRLARAVETIFVEELESWQAVFAGKNMSVPN